MEKELLQSLSLHGIEACCLERLVGVHSCLRNESFAIWHGKAQFHYESVRVAHRAPLLDDHSNPVSDFIVGRRSSCANFNFRIYRIKQNPSRKTAADSGEMTIADCCRFIRPIDDSTHMNRATLLQRLNVSMTLPRKHHFKLRAIKCSEMAIELLCDRVVCIRGDIALVSE